VQENKNSDSSGVANKLVNKILNESDAQAKSEIVLLKDKDKSASIQTTEATVAATLAMENANLTPWPHTDNSTMTSGNVTEATPSSVKQANLINEKEGESDTFKKAEKERIKYEQGATAAFNKKAEKNDSKVSYFCLRLFLTSDYILL